jgi:hypothetical protein
MLAGCDVVGVEIAEGESTTVEEHRDGVCTFPGIGVGCLIDAFGVGGPVDANRDRSGGSVDAEVLDSEVGMRWPARQFAQTASRGFDAVVDVQPEWN